jgi:hypothetical protein
MYTILLAIAKIVNAGNPPTSTSACPAVTLSAVVLVRVIQF